MPFTLIHVGPALAAKAVAPSKFSLLIFCLTQVVIDSEVAVYMMLGEWHIHRHLHTYLGATAVAVLAVLVGRPLLVWGIGKWNRLVGSKPGNVLWIEPRISLTAAIVGAVTGSYSQVLLDSIVHSDLRPFAPWSERNGMLGVLAGSELVLICLMLAVLGGAALLVALVRRRGRN